MQSRAQQSDDDVAVLVQRDIIQKLKDGEARVTVQHGLQAQQIIDRRVERAKDRELAVTLARLLHTPAPLPTSSKPDPSSTSRSTPRLARAGSFKSQTKGTAHGSRTHPLESHRPSFRLPRVRTCARQAAREGPARAQIPVTRQTIRANKANERTERLNQRIEATGKDAQQLAQRVAEAKAQVVSPGSLPDSARPSIQQQRMFTHETGVQPIDTTLGDRARLAAQQHSESIAALKAAKSQFQSTRRRTRKSATTGTPELRRRCRDRQQRQGHRRLAERQLGGDRLRARRKLAGWT